MGFLDKVKSAFSGPGIEVMIRPSLPFLAKEGVARFVVRVQGGPNDEEIKSIKVELVEHWSRGEGEDMVRKNFTLGEMVLPGFSLPANQAHEVQVELPFKMVNSDNDDLIDTGIAGVRHLGKLGRMKDQEVSRYDLSASVDVASANFLKDPSEYINVDIQR